MSIPCLVLCLLVSLTVLLYLYFRLFTRLRMSKSSDLSKKSLEFLDPDDNVGFALIPLRSPEKFVDSSRHKETMKLVLKGEEYPSYEEVLGDKAGLRTSSPETYAKHLACYEDTVFMHKYEDFKKARNKMTTDFIDTATKRGMPPITLTFLLDTYFTRPEDGIADSLVNEEFIYRLECLDIPWDESHFQFEGSGRVLSRYAQYLSRSIHSGREVFFDVFAVHPKYCVAVLDKLITLQNMGYGFNSFLRVHYDDRGFIVHVDKVDLKPNRTLY